MVPVLNPGDVCVVLGTQWGDEGKGKLVDTLASECDIIARCAVSYVYLVYILHCYTTTTESIILKYFVVEVKIFRKGGSSFSYTVF
jgi:hypothetical protein